MYQKTLDTDIEKGYVKPVIFSSIAPSRVWYLPHHPVTNPNKPGKVRRVSNAASVFKGNSLNSNLLTGPVLINNLVGLLLRFRENPVAVSADIEAMFMQKPSKFETNAENYTVRKLISLIACLFDPLGIIAPVIITLKIILQEIWKEGLAWDDSLPKEKIKSIQTWIDNYMCSPPIEIPRCLTLDVATRKAYELHVFTDASQLAYGAVAYARIISENGVSCSFLMSKAKVAPIKQLSIPKLELQAAVLGTRLAHFIKKHHTIEFKDTTFWCDSMAVLAWIKNSEKLKVFVGNRVSEIQSQSPTSSWRHISGKSNPADHVSRGILPADIKEHWLSPPAFLFKPKESRSTFLNTEKTNTTMARQRIQPVVAAKNFSKWTKLLKATAQVFRFIEILRTKSKTALNINDVENARNHLIQVSQQNSFGPSIALLNKNKNLPSKDKLLPLSPFLKDNILRVGGRTKRSTLGYNTKHPIVFNAKESIARLFLEKCHEISMHLEQRQGLQPPMADLPDARFPENESPVTFTNVGLDYIGPFTVIQRGKEEKAYICLFNCLVTRAVHLEVTEDLTTSSCMTAIRRFIARRGQPRLLLSDNGSNFLGARKQIRRQNLQLDHDFIKNNLLNQSDNEDEDPLTPNHFLIGRAFPNIPACVFNENPSLKMKSWTQIRQRLEAIWKRLVREYLPTLNTPRKWTNPESKLEVNDIVWVLEEWTPR
ncbi:uncharacterized protein LOC142352857 [Convolutriloba macropyga]|uniref:uncharacterized protein LOC142352857 n=1 Tax=Convolutriloba macropyga TaxID=536237 RepID=UPI003F527E72